MPGKAKEEVEMAGVVDEARVGKMEVGAAKEKRRRRKKRRKLSSPEAGVDEQGGALRRRLTDGLQVVQDFTSFAAQRNRDVTGVAIPKHPRDPPTGNGMEATKPSKKKRKRVDEESVETETTESTSVNAHRRVWRYVCNRAVLVEPKSVRGSEAHSGVPRNSVVTEVHVAGKKIVVTNTKEGAVAQAWLDRQRGTVFGLDAEWRPSFRKDTEHKIALLQICGESECLIVQMLYLDVIPTGLVSFLKDPAIKFPGVGVHGDAVKLKRDWGLECNGTVDLTALAATILGRPELKFIGLKALAKVVMDYDMAKPKCVTMSNWAKPVLDKVQVEYASLDAWVSYAIHQKLSQPDTDS